MEGFFFTILAIWAICQINENWGIKQESNQSLSFFYLFIPITVIILTQIISLPEGLINLLSPALFEIGENLGINSKIAFPERVTINYYATKCSILELITYVLLTFYIFVTFRRAKEIKKALYFFLIFAFLLSLFAIIQHYNWNGKIYWLKELTKGGLPFGSFVNRNHFAGFINLIIFPILSLILYRISSIGSTGRSEAGEHHLTIIMIFALSIIIAALFLSLSRGGVIGFASALLVFLYLQRREKGHINGWILICVLLASVSLLVIMTGAEALVSRLSTLAGFYEDGALLERIGAWRGTLEIISDFPIMGTGSGTFKDIFNLYRPESMFRTYVHAHNNYLQILAENGVVVFTFTILVIVFFIKGYSPLFIKLNSTEGRYIHYGIFCGLVAVMVHELVEFNLRVPGNAYLFGLMAGLCMALARKDKEPRRPNRRTLLFIFCLSLLLLIIVTMEVISLNSISKPAMVNDESGRVGTTSTRDAGLLMDVGRLSEDEKRYDDALVYYSKAVREAPFKDIAWAKKGNIEFLIGKKEASIADIAVAVKLNPNNTSYRYYLATLYLKSDKKEDALREAVELSKKTGWLTRAIDLLVKNSVPFSQIKRLGEGNSRRLVAISEYFEKKGDVKVAGNALTEALLLSPEEIELQDKYARFFIRHKNFDDLTKMKTLYMSSVPARVYYWVGEGYLRMMDAEKAASAFIEAVNKNPQEILYLERLSQAYFKLEEYEKALDIAENVIASNEVNDRAYSVIIAVYEKRKDWIKTLESLKRAVKLFPNRFDFHYRLAHVYMKLSMEGFAVRELNKCLNINPDHIGVRLKLGDLYLSLNRFNEALQQYQTILTLRPGNMAVIRRIQDMVK